MRAFHSVPLLVSLLCGAVLACNAEEQVYRTVDKEGRVIYSDRPSEGAEAVRLGPTNTMTEAAPTAPQPGTSSPESVPERPYTNVAITEPADGETVAAPAGSFTVRYRVEPRRRAEDAVRLLIDGKPAGTNTAEGVRVSNAERGDHRLQIQILDREGKLLAQSGSVRVLVVRQGTKKRPD